jgi:hypothetical protein
VVTTGGKRALMHSRQEGKLARLLWKTIWYHLVKYSKFMSLRDSNVTYLLV